MLGQSGTAWLAIGVMVAVVAMFVARVVLHMQSTRVTWPQAPFYLIHLIYTRIVWRATVDRPLPIEPDQGAVIICNHASPVDPFFVQLAADKAVHWMVAREYALNPLLAWAFRIMGAIPVNRGGIDTAATKQAIRLAHQGERVGLLPEGRINTTSEVLLPGRPGAALIAVRAKVPVVPCYVHGAPYDGTAYGCFLMPAKVQVKVGDPIDISAYYDREPEKEDLEELTLRFMSEMAKLAGVPDFEPKLAGRFYAPRFDPQ